MIFLTSKDPLNLPPWRKWAITLLLGLFSATSVLLTSGMGAIFQNVQASYPGQESRATDLLTYPTLFMGIGNLIGMPLALAVGRRPVFLAATLLLTVTGIWCACSKTLGSHIAGRDILSLAAGQSEALIPMMVQEIHFLHERGTKLGWVSAMQAIGTAAFFLAQNYMVADLGWRWWYGLFTIINGATFIVGFIFICETGYSRPDDAVSGAVHLDFNEKGDVEAGGVVHKIIRVTTADGNVLDLDKYTARTWKNDLSLASMERDWSQIIQFYKHLLQCCCVPSMVWILILNGAYLGLYVIGASTFASVLLAPPYNFAFESLGFVQAGQIVDSILFLPLGYGTDYIIKLMTRWNKGLYEPEYRLMILVFPAIVGIVCSVIYGQAGSHPMQYTWGTVAVTYNAIFFAFLGANIVGITYAIDCFPLKAGPVLVLICAGRGLISFGLSYSTLPTIKTLGYDGTMGTYAGIIGSLSLLGIPCFFFGRHIREFAQRRLAL